MSDLPDDRALGERILLRTITRHRTRSVFGTRMPGRRTEVTPVAAALRLTTPREVINFSSPPTRPQTPRRRDALLITRHPPPNHLPTVTDDFGSRHRPRVGVGNTNALHRRRRRRRRRVCGHRISKILKRAPSNVRCP